jgi:hypothetical protein
MTMNIVPKPAFVLGYAGLIPFVTMTFGPYAGLVEATFAEAALLAFGAVILSFMAGIQWGLAMARHESTYMRLGVSILPAIVAWLALLVGGPVGLVVLAVTFALILVYDLQLVAAGLAAPWYPKLRWPLTIIVVACLLFAALVG